MNSQYGKGNRFASNFTSIPNQYQSTHDVTIVCQGQICKAHKWVLSTCSPFFKSILENKQDLHLIHPTIFLNHIPLSYFTSILEYMYTGQLPLPGENVPSYLRSARMLKVVGFTEGHNLQYIWLPVK